MSTSVVELRGISKVFPGVDALSDVHLDIAEGQIHGLVGENGAGKTTLLRILSGIYSPTSGEVILRGHPVRLTNPVQAVSRGIGAVHQELSLCSALNVAENVFFGRQPARKVSRLIRNRALYTQTQQLLDRLKLRIAPTTPVYNLSIAEQQQVEILKALSLKPDILLLDEPTSTLSGYEIAILFRVLEDLREQGKTIIYVSHKLHEIQKLCDTISVLRDGKHVGTLSQEEADEATLVRMMTGRATSDLYPPRLNPSATEPRLRVQGLHAHVKGVSLKDIDLAVYPGEIVGVAGLVGSGRTEMAEALFGAHRWIAGTVSIDGKEVTLRSPWDSIRHGISYVPEDRKASGLFLEMDVAMNIISNELQAVSSVGFVNKGYIRNHAEHYISSFRIKTAGHRQTVGYLSGGNQQKIMLARFLSTHPTILIVDEPTRGIDVGAKREIHFLLNELAEQGAAILMISSELEEILGFSNRLYVMYAGRIIAEYDSEKTTDEEIMQAIVTAAREGGEKR